MENKKLGKEQAFTPNDDKHGNCVIHEIVMSKRFYAACAVMQWLSADPNFLLDSKGIKLMVELSYKVADELLKQEFGD